MKCLGVDNHGKEGLSVVWHTHATQRYLSFAEGCSRKSLSLIVRPLTASPSCLYPNFANGAWGLPDLHEHPTQRSGTRAHAVLHTRSPHNDSAIWASTCAQHASLGNPVLPRPLPALQKRVLGLSLRPCGNPRVSLAENSHVNRGEPWWSVPWTVVNLHVNRGEPLIY